ncbi:hypothetical protein LLCC_0726 [Lactococcus cremoris]|uniref:ECF-type sigma factor negative effector n=2 Tax=Lactococcus lactis subsp. cremoris TaxID=1359 RepID=A0AAD1NJ19_LACLC|nr:anti-sigma factor [Lactococcus cremoris]BBC75122.1 hypothetical protein LLCC_0726 [Lactococcus cremoris]BCO03790.1 hypothetical protein LLG32_18840 [Lactococcus cremoris]BCO06642.1 hypothetical protein LLC_18820 [Lactococcus cremoris]
MVTLIAYRKDLKMRTLLIFPYLVLAITFFFGLLRLILFTVKKIQRRNQSTNSHSNLNNDFHNFATKTKLKRWGITSWIAMTIFSAFIVIAWQVNSALMEKNYFKTFDFSTATLTAAAPNIGYNNQIINDYGIFNSNLHSDTYKDIDGYRVPWQAFDFAFGVSNVGTLSLDTLGTMENSNAYFTQTTNQKIASFFSTKTNYKSKEYYGIFPTRDAGKISQLANHVAEAAVTFDKPYSYKEIQKMIPEDLLINWYWIGYNNTKSLAAASQTNWFGLMSNSNHTGNGNNSQLTGKLDNAAYQDFKKSLTEIAKTNQITINDFSPSKDALKQVKKYPTLKSAKFSGVILTGQTKNFANLDKNPWVYASNVGLTVELRPDIQPLK